MGRQVKTSTTDTPGQIKKIYENQENDSYV
jgi:hypothetical protein